MTLVAPKKTKIKPSKSRVIDAILRKGQFQIKQWHSSNKKVHQTDEQHVDFLGKKWNKVRGTITFKKTEIVAEEKPVTKRNCPAYLAQLWDPTGLVTPTTIEMRIDLQELWSSGYSWDEVLPDEIQTNLKKMSKYSTNVVSTNTKES